MKCAIIGMGVIGHVHYGILKDRKENLCAVCDIDENKLAEFSGIKTYTDYKQMLETERPEIVHICTPHYLHAEMVIYALKLGINVFCEKPLCIKREEIDAVLEAEKNSTAQLGVCMQNRYLPVSKCVKEYLKDKKEIGGYGSVVWHRGKEYYGSAAWRGKKATEGGGVLINQALHTLDLMQWLVGMPEKVVATASNLTLKDTNDVEDTVAALFEGKKGNMSLFATVGSKAEFPWSVVLSADGNQVRIEGINVTINGKVQSFEEQNTFYGKPCYGMGHGPIIDDFYSCVKTGKKFPLDGTEAMKVIRLLLSVYESNGNEIDII